MVSLSPLIPCDSHLMRSAVSLGVHSSEGVSGRGGAVGAGPMGGCLEAGYLCVVKCKEILSWRREQWWRRGTSVGVAAPSPLLLLLPSRSIVSWGGVGEECREGGGRGVSLQPPLKEAQYFYGCRACVESHSYLRIKQSNMYISNISTDESFSVQIKSWW